MPTLTKLYTMREASQHNTKDDCWVVIDGKIKLCGSSFHLDLDLRLKFLVALVFVGRLCSSSHWVAILVLGPLNLDYLNLVLESCSCFQDEEVEESSDHGQDYDPDVPIFDVRASIFSGEDYDQTQVNVHDCEKKVDVCAYGGAPIFDNYGDEDDLVESRGVLEDEESFVDGASFVLTLFPMKEVVAIPPSIPFLDSTKIMVES
ncbi:hypothetical protein TEA_016694 [Camellia sinensis var. sinensis]|uniref:Uncharacterized protein n=1 Tax=Camellia sinensis var. sinensis TaxID=542762 RepID=A0A4S4DR03_CAMSN|nr:hypothetical protein TEA_016694 [Camellia sinensis var. sinensis]